MARIPSYRLHKPSGKAVVTLNGKDHYLGKHGTRESKRAYDKLINEWQASGRSTSFGMEVNQATIAMLRADYIDHCEVHYQSTGGKHNNETKQSRRALNFLEPYDDELAKDFGPLKLKAVRQRMLDSVNAQTGKPLSRQYINKMVDRIVRMFRWGAENQIVKQAVHEELANVKGLQKGRTSAPEAPPVKPIDDRIVAKTIEHCTPVVRDMILLQQYTGMRPGEVCALTPSMIDRTGKVWIARPEEHKGAWRGKHRSIFMGKKAQEVVLPYLLRAGDATLFSPKEADEQRRAKRRAERVTPLSCGNRAGTNKSEHPQKVIGDSYKTSSYARAILHACAKAYPIPDGASKEDAAKWRAKWWWSPNQLRHSAATKIRREFGIEAAQVMLGHAKLDVTQLYAEICEQKGVEVAAMIG